MLSHVTIDRWDFLRASNSGARARVFRFRGRSVLIMPDYEKVRATCRRCCVRVSFVVLNRRKTPRGAKAKKISSPTRGAARPLLPSRYMLGSQPSITYMKARARDARGFFFIVFCVFFCEFCFPIFRSIYARRLSRSATIEYIG